MNTKLELEIKVDNIDLIKRASEQAVKVALEAVGLQAENYAKRLCPVDTGNLRNSITHNKAKESLNMHRKKTVYIQWLFFYLSPICIENYTEEKVGEDVIN